MGNTIAVTRATMRRRGRLHRNGQRLGRGDRLVRCAAMRPWMAALVVAALGARRRWARAAAQTTWLDPVGDSLIPDPDITSVVSSCQNGIGAQLTMNFQSSISPPGSGQVDEISGLIEIDVDQNTATCPSSCPASSVTDGISCLPGCIPFRSPPTALSAGPDDGRRLRDRPGLVRVHEPARLQHWHGPYSRTRRWDRASSLIRFR